MRLLRLDARGDVSLTKDLLHDRDVIPPYAILSHTWGPDHEEVTYQDVVQRAAPSKAGFAKILFCGQQAAKDGLDHFWVDTCCIDKTNNTELAEAINSMFRWYQESAKCYVYLADVQRGKPPSPTGSFPSTWQTAFEQSRWFTRGWTLQELIAPSFVDFFTSDGQRLGDKSSLGQLVRDITQLPLTAIQGQPLEDFTFSERILWSRNRVTTRPEDKAYSLLGILGVYMAPIYGEGESHAFERLYQEASGRSLSTVLKRLPIAERASFDSHAEEHNATCHPETRVDILQELSHWVVDSRKEAIFWLSGMAGTGKSTIARTIAQYSSEQGLLGGNFFFKRGEADSGTVSKLFTTIAAQLVSKEPGLSQNILNILDSDPAITGKSMREQFEKLILGPLSALSRGSQNKQTLLILIDALDECEPEEDIKLLIKIFSGAKTLQAPRLRFLLTSRPELPIRLGFAAIQGSYRDLILHEIPENVIEHDISLFLDYKLACIRKDYNMSVSSDRQLPMTWPRQRDIRTLVKMAIPLFIFAATVCRFLSDRRCGSPNLQLQEVLKYRTKSQESQLDATYLPVLDQLVKGLPKRKRDEVVQRFRDIVGSIVILENPLSLSGLARLLDMPQSVIGNVLDLLHSVLSIPKSTETPITLFHLSFRDFLLDPEKEDTNLFWVDEKKTHKKLAAECLRVMNSSLRANIADLQDPGIALSNIDPQIIRTRLQPELQYACRFWAHHTQQAGMGDSRDEVIYSFLTTHFLHWLEALSLMGKFAECATILRIAQSLVAVCRLTHWKTTPCVIEAHMRQDDQDQKLVHFILDARKFLTAATIVRSHPLQLYHSALVFAPEISIVRNCFENAMPLTPPRVGKNWRQCLKTLDGHLDKVTSAVFSHDSLHLVSASDDNTINLWLVDTGECLQTLIGHHDTVTSVEFSHDSMMIVSASSDGTLKIWSKETGEYDCQQTLKCSEGGGLLSMARFSHDSKLLASVSSSRTIQIWQADEDIYKLCRTLEGHSGNVNSLAFSHNSNLLASASWDRTVKIWSMETGTCQKTLTGHHGHVTSVAFSYDSGSVASTSDDDIRVWDTSTGLCTRTLRGAAFSHNCVVFSPDSRLIAAASDKTVNIWCADTGRLLQSLQGHHNSINSVSFSPDSVLLATSSNDETIRIWSTSERLLESEGHDGDVTSVAISPDSRLVASAALDMTVRVWSAETGEYLSTYFGHKAYINSVVFSYDSELIASASDDHTINVWSLQGQFLGQLSGHGRQVDVIMFSFDSDLLASGSHDLTARIWSRSGGWSCQQVLEGHDGRVTAIAFSRDGELVLTGSTDLTSRIWSRVKGQCLQILRGHRSYLVSVAISEDSRVVASNCLEGEIRIWSAETGSCQGLVLEPHMLLPNLKLHCQGSTHYLSSDSGMLLLKASTRSRETSSKDDKSSVTFPAPGGNLYVDSEPFGYGMSGGGCWLTLHGKRLMWLPEGSRPRSQSLSELTAVSVSTSTVVFGCDSGRVIILRLPEQMPPS